MRGTIALFIHHPKCAADSANGIMQALSPHYRFKILTRYEPEDDFFDDVDMVAFPGGIGDADSFDYLLRQNRSHINRFMRNGGRYLGICMGAYWAGHHYFGYLQGLQAEQYIKRPMTDIRRSFSTTVPVSWQNKPERMFFYDGCALVGDTTGSEVVATYANGDPMAVIQGRVGVIGCHPESTPHWFPREKKYLHKHWHQGRHHKLLLKFVDQLMSK